MALASRTPRSHAGAMRFAPDRDNSSSKVNVYQLPLDVVRAKYGRSPMDVFTREMYKKFKSKKMTNKQMAEATGLSEDQIKHIIMRYNFVPKEEIKVDIKNLTVSQNTELTVIQYLEFKKQKITDEVIRKKFNMSVMAFNNWKKKNGLIGVSLNNDKRVNICYPL